MLKHIDKKMYYLVYTFLFLFFSIPCIINADKTVFGQNDNDNLENQTTNKTIFTFSKYDPPITNQSETILSQQDPPITNQSETILSQQNDQNLTSQKIEIPTTEFNLFLDTVKTSIDLLGDDNTEEALSKLGLAVIQILDSTQRYQELVQFASSQYTNIDEN